jgi:hypothetical protein
MTHQPCDYNRRVSHIAYFPQYLSDHHNLIDLRRHALADLKLSVGFGSKDVIEKHRRKKYRRCKDDWDKCINKLLEVRCGSVFRATPTPQTERCQDRNRVQEIFTRQGKRTVAIP